MKTCEDCGKSNCEGARTRYCPDVFGCPSCGKVHGVARGCMKIKCRCCLGTIPEAGFCPYCREHGCESRLSPTNSYLTDLPDLNMGTREERTMTTIDPDTQRGLYGKYRVEKVNGKPIGRVFILAYDKDPHARVALAAYADSCEKDYPQLAADLRQQLT